MEVVTVVEPSVGDRRSGQELEGLGILRAQALRNSKAVHVCTGAADSCFHLAIEHLSKITEEAQKTSRPVRSS